jgi:glycine oxidase
VDDHPVWEDRLDAEEEELLRRGTGEPHPRPDVLVVGGGIAGLATALFCRRAGVERVTVLERGPIGGGATGGAAAILAPDAHEGVDPPAFVSFARASLDLYRELTPEWTSGIGLVDLDLLVPAGVETDYPPRRPPGARDVDEHEVARLAPTLPATRGCLLESQARVNPSRVAARFAERAGRVTTGVEVTGVDVRHGRVVSVSTSTGRLAPGSVLFATGMGPRLRGLSLHIAGRPIKGHLLATAPVPLRLEVGLAGAIGVLVQLEDGGLLYGGTLDPDDHTHAVDEAVIAAMLIELHRLFPAASDARVTHRWCCFRPAAADGLPVVDRVPGLDNAWVACGLFRTGILLAPATGRALARWMMTGGAPADVTPFALSGRGLLPAS